ncbi:hypothetical protein PIB30_007106 [Stylosanthes scabra]|uniref:Tetratricopeptide repeat protein 1 n=1 Tax=Stylosanthes scabra TaxID=79078 RepID=A0ABU6S3Z4_9FABA|nr:hypothetical protein [Stylosanthes scabra]
MVVVIEHQETEDLNANPSNNPVAGNDASDGFETASDTDLRSDTEGDDIANSREEQDHPDQQQPKKARPEQDPEQSVSPSNGSSGDPLINEELEQKLLVQANEVKTEGNKFFVDGKYEEALSQYEHALQVAPEVPSSVEIRSICHVNRAVCFQKLGKYDNSVKECTKALELNPVYIKALVRRGEAHESLNILKRPLLEGHSPT